MDEQSREKSFHSSSLLLSFYFLGSISIATIDLVCTDICTLCCTKMCRTYGMRGESLYNWYCAIVFMGAYATGELGHFLIGIISRPIAQEMEWGEEGCIVNDTSISYEEQRKCEKKNVTEYVNSFCCP